MDCTAVLGALLASHVLLRLYGSGRVWVDLLELDLGTCPHMGPDTDSLWVILRNLDIGSNLRGRSIKLLVQDLIMVH